MLLEATLPLGCWALLGLQALTAAGLYLAANHLLHSNIQREILTHLRPIHISGEEALRRMDEKNA